MSEPSADNQIEERPVPWEHHWSGASYFDPTRGRMVYPTNREMDAIGRGNRHWAREQLYDRRRASRSGEDRGS